MPTIDVTYASDIHLEFGGLHITEPGGDVLLLAGDILTVAPFHGDRKLKRHRDKFLKFLDDVSSKWKRVFYITGNHEPYNADYNTMNAVLEPILKARGITLLNNEIVPLRDDVLLFGATLWTDFAGGDDYVMHLAEYRMNDYRIVRNWSPQRALDAHRESVETLEKVAQENADKTILVMTHHAPDPRGLNPVHSSNLDACYFTDLKWLPMKYPNIKYWVHGHTHIVTEYEIAQCKVMANCRGYINYEAMADSFEFKTFHVE